MFDVRGLFFKDLKVITGAGPEGVGGEEVKGVVDED